MKKRKPRARSARAPAQAGGSTLPENFFYRNKSELPKNYKRPLRRRKLKPLEYAYWREHQIKLFSRHYLNSKRCPRGGGGIPEGVDWCVISRGGADHRRTFFLDRLMPPTPSIEACGGAGDNGSEGGE